MAIVALTFPDVFMTYERHCCDETVRNTWPVEWEQIHGRQLEPGESWTKDKTAFKQNHVGDCMVTSAIRSSLHTGMVEVVARRGNAGISKDEESRFLVPSGVPDARPLRVRHR